MDPMTFAITRLWNDYRSGAGLSELATRCQHAQEWLYLAVLSFAAGHDRQAAQYAHEATRADPAGVLYTEAARYLARIAESGRAAVYAEPEGFAAFIRGGGNVELYSRLSQWLAAEYQRHAPVTLLDIGVGDGMALLPALSSAVRHVDLLEPSAEMLTEATSGAQRTGVAHRSWPVSLDQLGGDIAAWPEQPWTIAQSTFALHNVPRAQRESSLRRLRAHADRLFVAEFDVPARYDTSPQCFEYVTSRYVNGLAEYDGDGSVVAQGFLMPVMFGYFDPAVTHDDQPIDDWMAEFSGYGYTVTPHRLYDYWFATAYLLELISADPEDA